VRHARAERLLSEYLDGALSIRRVRGVEAHLLACEACRAELVALRRTRSLLRELRGVEDAPDLAAQVLARIESGEAAVSPLERLRAGIAEWFTRPWMAPLATAAVGLVLLALVPPIEVEVRIPGIATLQPERQTESAPSARAPMPLASQRVSRPAFASASRRVSEPALPLASRRLPEMLVAPSLDLPQRLPIASFDCMEHPYFEGCQEQVRALMNLALHDTPEFLTRLEGVSPSARERWIGELSDRAARDGSARSMAERLRESDDPRAWQLAPRFEAAAFAGR